MTQNAKTAGILAGAALVGVAVWLATWAWDLHQWCRGKAAVRAAGREH